MFQVLRPNPTGIVWKAGQQVETRWSIRANHGGGYIYRLCPASEPLNEACFNRLTLPFSGVTNLLWGDGTRQLINTTLLSEGTRPEGSTWAMNPEPYADPQTKAQFPAPCVENNAAGPNNPRSEAGVGRCSGRFPYNTTIIDRLTVPADVVPGAYVLSLRYDCEATAQVWTNCADIVIA